MADIKLACINCHIIIFAFGVFLLVVFGFFTLFDFYEFHHKELAAHNKRGVCALIYWIPAALHLGGTIGLIIWKKKISKAQSVGQSSIHEKSNEEIVLPEVIKEQIPLDEMIISMDSASNKSDSKAMISSIN